MAITGRFLADFTEFTAAVEKAEVTLKGLETGSAKVEKSLNRMVDQFSGRKLIQDAMLMTEAVERLGGASKLTEDELARVAAKASEAAAKMRALGMEVPAGMQKLASETTKAGTAASMTSKFFGDLGSQLAGMFTAGAVLAFGKQILDTGDRIQKMADQTGMATDEVQEFMYIAGQSGSDVGALTGAVSSLQEKLGSNDAGLIGALNALGINLEELKSKSPAQQMYTIADAIRALPTEADRAAAAFAVFGNKFKEIMPAIMSGMQDLATEAPKMSKEAVQALDELGDSFTKVQQVAVVFAASVLRTMQDGVQSIAEFAQRVNPLNIMQLGPSNAALMKQYVEENNKIIASLGGVKPAADAAGAGIKSFGDKLAEQKKAQEDAAARTKKLQADTEAAAKKAAAEAEAAAKELAAWAEGYDEITAAGMTWQSTVDGIDESLVAHIETLLEAGISAEKLAKAYSLTTIEVNAIARGMKEAEEATKRANAVFAETTKLQIELEAARAQRTGSDTDAAIAQINRWADTYKAKLTDAGIFTAEIGEQIEAIRKEKIIGASTDWDVLKKASVDTLNEAALRAKTTYEVMMADSSKYSTQAILDQEAIAREAAIAAESWSTSFTGAAETMGLAAHHAAGEVRAAAQEAAMSWSQAMEAVRQGQGTMSGQLPGGGPGTMTNYGPWGSAEHKAAVAKAYAAGRYFGPVKTRGGGGYGPGYGGQSYDVDWEALGMATGGPVSKGHPYMVGEKGPELFVPEQNGGIVPNGAGGSVINNFYINGTGQDVARVVSAELTRQMRVGRKWPAV